MRSEVFDDTASQLRDLVSGQRLAVLATSGTSGPYVSLVAFVCDEPLRNLAFATPKPTRKYANLMSAHSVSVLIDSRSNTEADFHEALAVTALGEAHEAEGDERSRWADLYIDRHPHLREFVESPTTALFVVRVRRYIMVSRFQNVVETDPSTWTTSQT